MELLGVLLGLAALLGPWVIAIVALVHARRAREEARDARDEARRALAAAGAAWKGARAGEATGAAPEAAPLETTLVAASAAGEPPAAAEPLLPAAPPPPLFSRASLPPPPAAPAAVGLEEKIALVWFTRAGALAVLAGAAYFLKYAVDNAWLGPLGRLALAAASGAAALAGGEALRARTRPVWVHALQGAGLALLFFAGFASHALYRLFPLGVAFAAVAAVAVLGGALAVRHRAELLLALSLLGGLLAPILLSTGEDRPLALFGYLLVLAAGALLVSARLGFRVVPWLAFAGTIALAAGWWERFFDVHAPPGIPDASSPLDEQHGRYFPLSARLVPVGAALAFAAAWLAAHVRLARAWPRALADGWLAAGVLFALVAPFELLFDRPLLGGLALAGGAAIAAWRLARAGRLPLLLGVELVALGLLAASVQGRGGGHDAAWILAVALVAAVHLAAVAHAWLVRGVAPGAALVAVAAVAGFGFTAAALALTDERQTLLRAALAGAAGGCELALGAATLRRARTHASALLGAALALFAGAAAFLLSGASVTVAWAAMACAVAVLAARERDPWWLGGAAATFAAVLMRLAAVDLPSVDLATTRFLTSLGAEGRLRPVFLLNPRAMALAAAAVAFLVAARAVRRAEAPWRPGAAVLALAGWALAVALVVTEARGVALVLPAPPPAGDAAAFALLRDAVLAARREQWGALSAVTSLVLAVCAALLVGGGFVFRDAFHRWLGLGLFAIVLGKLVLADVWRLSRLQQVAVFLIIGCLLLAAAFLYARFGRRIAAALRDAPPPRGGPALLLVAAAGLAVPGGGAALDTSVFRVARDVEVAAPGLTAVEADAALFRASRAADGSLGDVRLEAPGGAEVPFALRIAGEPAGRDVEGAVLDPVVLPDGAVRAVVDLGPAPPRHGELRLDLAGDEFLRAVRLEVSDDGRSFGLLSEGARVWAIGDAARTRSTAVRHPASRARFVRVTLLPGAGKPPRITGARIAAGDAPAAPMRTLALAAPAPSRSPDGHESFLDLDLGGPGLPVEEITVASDSPAFDRRIRVLASADGAHWVPAGGGVVWRALRSGGAPQDTAETEGLRLAASTGARRHVRLAFADGDSPPLPVRELRVGWRPRRIVFRADAPGKLVLLCGADLRPPSYDLAGLLERSGEPDAAPARLGPSAPNSRFRAAEPVVPFSERHRWIMSAALAALLAALALWAVRLLRAPPSGGA